MSTFDAWREWCAANGITESVYPSELIRDMSDKLDELNATNGWWNEETETEWDRLESLMDEAKAWQTLLEPR